MPARTSFPYPRRYQYRIYHLWAWVAAICVLGGGFYTYKTIEKINEIADAERTVHQTETRNHLWYMIAGRDPLDDTHAGQLARIVRDLERTDHPIRELRGRSIGPGELPGISDEVGYPIFRNGGDQGPFTDGFILDALTAESTDTVADVITKVPGIPPYGWFRWEWGAEGLGGVLTVALFTHLLLARSRRRYSIVAQRRYVQRLSSDARRAYDLVLEAEDLPEGKKRTKLLEDANAHFDTVLKGLGPTKAKQTHDLLASRLRDEQEAWHQQAKAYNEVTNPKAPDEILAEIAGDDTAKPTDEAAS